MSRIADFYHRHFLWLELLFAAAAAMAFMGFTELAWGHGCFADFLKGSRQPVYGSVASLTGSLLGFVIAAVPITLGFVQMPRLKVVRDSEAYPEVFRIFFQGIYWLSFAAVWSLVALLTDTDASPRVYVAYIMVFLFLASAVRVCRCVWVLKRITTIATQDHVKS